MESTALAPDFHDHTAGRLVGMHAHAEGQVLIAIDGRMDVRVGATRIEVSPLTALWVPPGVPHATCALEATAFRGIMVDRANADLLPRRPRSFSAAPILLAAVPELAAARARRRALAASVLLDELFARPAAPPTMRDAALEGVCARVLTDPARAPSLDAAAREAGLSRRSFSRAFRAAAHKGWSAWVREIRLGQAAALLADGTRVSDAALAVGYATPSAFSTAFRRWAGRSPIEARSECIGGLERVHAVSGTGAR